MRFRFGQLELDDGRITLSGPAGPVHVEPQVFAVLHHLIVHRDRVVTKEELLDTVWGDRFVSESALSSRIKAARRAVGDDGQAQRVIRTVHARGYQFVAEVRVDGGGTRPPLPRLRSAPIGRDHDIASVAARTREARLVTVTGFGGIGKTTVALAVADRVQVEHADGVAFVDLAPVPAGAEVTRAVAEAAGVEGAAAETADLLADHLAGRPVLVVLDNCEHVLASAARLVDRMLRRGGPARVLATSRAPLGVPGEHVWPLGPLHDGGADLFVERARAAEPRVAWDPSDPAVVELCRRLDGVPLALELAAGQLRRFDLDELTRRLDDRLALLAGPGAGDAPRHATMETAIDWSYRLLDTDEQRLLRHLSVFPSWFDVGAVEATAPPLERTTPLAAFGDLVDKSLVVRRPGAGRYRLLETIRMFTADRLRECDETPAAVERHRRHACARAAAASRLDRWLSGRLAAGYRTDLDDARQALGVSLRQGLVADAVEIAVGGSFLWRNAIGCVEGEAWVDDLDGLDLPPRDRLWVHILRADLGQGRGDHHQMSGAARSAREVAGYTDDLEAACLAAHFDALAHLTDPEDSQDRLADALDLAHRSGDERLATLIGAFRAVADLAAGRHEEARTSVQRLEPAASDHGYDRFIVHWAGWLLALAERDPGASRRWMSQQQEYLDRTGIVETWISSFSSALSDVLDGHDARTILSHSLDLAAREGYAADGDCLLALAYAEICADRFEVAAELVGTARNSRFNATAHRALYRAVLDPLLRANLDAGTIAEAMARGRRRPATAALAAHGVGAGVTA